MGNIPNGRVKTPDLPATKIVLEFDGLPPSLNATLGIHWSKLKPIKDKWRTYAEYMARETNLRIVNAKALVHVHMHLGDKNRRDEDNLRGGGMKYVMDGLVRAGVIVDDDIYHIETKYTFDDHKPKGFTITITEIPGE